MNKWFALPHRTRLAIGLWFALLGGVLGRVAFDKVTAQSVLPIYLEGGRRWANAEPLYAPMPEGMDLYRNPPFVAMLTVPFTVMPPRFAALLWRILQIGLFALGLKHFLRDVLPPLTPFQRDWFWLLNAIIVLSAFNNAQLNLLLVASALLGVAAAARGAALSPSPLEGEGRRPLDGGERGFRDPHEPLSPLFASLKATLSLKGRGRHWWASAFWLVLAAQVKIYPIALLGLVCVCFPKPMFPRCVLLLALGLALPMAFGNPEYAFDQYRGFAAAMQADDRSEVPMVRAPRDWTYLPRSFADVVVPRGVAMVVSAAAGIAFAAWVGLVRKEERLRMAFCLGMLWMLLFGPSTEMNTYSILAPVAAWLAVRDRAGWLAWFGAALLVASILRASFPTEMFHGLGFMQPMAAMLILLHLMLKSGGGAEIETDHQPSL